MRRMYLHLHQILGYTSNLRDGVARLCINRHLHHITSFDTTTDRPWTDFQFLQFAKLFNFDVSSPVVGEKVHVLSLKIS